MAVRLAIGAGRGRIVRQLVIEGLIVSATGAAMGVGLAWALARFLVDLISTGPFLVEFDLTPNGHVLAFSAGLAVITGIGFGLAPALHTRRNSAQLAASSHERTGTTKSRLLPSLVALQVGLSLVLVAMAGLLVRTLSNLQQLDLGFSTDRVLVTSIDRGSVPRESSIEDQLLEELRRIPGVTSVTLTTHTPLDGSSWSEAVAPIGKPLPQNDNARMIAVGPEYFKTFEIPLVLGRAFTDRDRTGGAAVAIVNQRFADREFPNQDPIGQRIVTTTMGRPATIEIVGVSKDAKFSGLRRLAPATVFLPYAQFGGDFTPSLAIRGNGSERELREAMHRLLQARLPEAAVEVRALGTQVSATILRERLMASLAAGFGILAILLASVGLYGLLAFSVAQQFREIGIRMALGAQPSGVVGRVLFSAGRLVAIGLVMGLPAAWAASRSIESMLFGLRATDPVTMGGAILLLIAAALLASYLPARRAARVDPLVALRHE
jgi:putative ABC transport system permease protein